MPHQDAPCRPLLKRVSRHPRILLVSCNYFLIREIRTGLSRLGVPFQEVPVQDDAAAFAQALAQAALSFRPDFVLTINRYGLDDSGRMLEVLQALRLPVACWLVDSADILLGGLTRPEEGILTFSCDKAFAQAPGQSCALPPVYLPLAADPTVFRPSAARQAAPDWRTRVSFVGHSWADSIETNLRTYRYPAELTAHVQDAAVAWEASHLPLRAYLSAFHPRLAQGMDALDSARKKWFTALLLWTAAKLRRVRQVSRILEFTPLIVGDPHWKKLLHGLGSFQYLHSIDYDTLLPAFYTQSDIVFNCTSPQMSGALNQRLFDVPACGSFVLTDRRAELEEMFEIGTEIACYDSEPEVVETIRYYLQNTQKRKEISRAARKRVLAHHTYDHRLRQLIDEMRRVFGAPAGNVRPCS